MVAQQLVFSLAQPLLSYAAPTVASVAGCIDLGNDTTACPRNGGVVLTVRGANFGPVAPKVIVGGAPCGNVQQPLPGQQQSLVVCALPPGTGVSLAVLLFQDQGRVSTDLVYVRFSRVVNRCNS